MKPLRATAQQSVSAPQVWSAEEKAVLEEMHANRRGLNQQELDALAELRGEGRTFEDRRSNFHD